MAEAAREAGLRPPCFVQLMRFVAKAASTRLNAGCRPQYDFLEFISVRTAMPDSIEMHPEMQILIDAKADLPAAKTVAEMRAGWTMYSGRMRCPHPAEMKVEDRDVD